jgi:hypothetical protein
MPWYTCSVLKAGPSAEGTETASPVIYIMLTDQAGSFGNCWFYAANSAKNEMLTAALAALGSGASVSILADAPKTNNSSYTQITQMQVLAASAATPSVAAFAVQTGSAITGIRPFGPPDMTVHNLTVTGDIFLTATASIPWQNLPLSPKALG